MVGDGYDSLDDDHTLMLRCSDCGVCLHAMRQKQVEAAAAFKTTNYTATHNIRIVVCWWNSNVGPVGGGEIQSRQHILTVVFIQPGEDDVQTQDDGDGNEQ